jgi:hypothetical protein
VWAFLVVPSKERCTVPPEGRHPEARVQPPDLAEIGFEVNQ